MSLSLRAKVLVLTIAIIVILLISSHLITSTLVAQGLEARLTRRIEQAGENLDEWISARRDRAVSTARFLAELDWLQSTVTYSSEPNYLSVLIPQYLRRSEPDLLRIDKFDADLKGGWVYQVNDDPQRFGWTIPGRQMDRDSREGQPGWTDGYSDVIRDSSSLILAACEPIKEGPRTNGIVTIGVIIDSAAVENMRLACGCDELAIVAGGEVLMSSMRGVQSSRIFDSLPEPAQAGRSFAAQIGPDSYLVLAAPLRAENTDVVAQVLLMVSKQEMLSLLGTISNALNLGALLAFLVFSAISIVMSGRLTGKLNRLVSHVVALGEGRYEEPVEKGADDEVGVLADSFDNLRIKLRQRTQELTSANEDLDRRVREIGSLNSVMVAIASNLPMDAVFAVIASEIGKHLSVDFSYLALRFKEGPGMRVLAWFPKEADGAQPGTPPLAPGASMAEEASAAGKATELNGLSAASRRSDEAWMASFGLRHACALPLHSEGDSIGCLVLAGKNKLELDEHTLTFLERLATEITVALQRLRLNEELGLIEDRLTRLFDSSRDGIFQTDPEGNLVFLNAAGQAMFGFPHSDGEAGPNLEAMFVKAQEKKNLLRRLNENGYVSAFPATLTRADDSTFEAELTANFTDDEEGQRGIEGIVRDVTKRKRLEQQLLRSERLASMGQVAAGVAHEINNPLGIVLGFTQDIMSGKAPEDPDLEALRVIEQETQRCARVVKDLLNLARSDRFLRERLDLNELLEKTLKLFKLHLRDGGIELETDFGEPPAVLGDEQQLQQVFMNIILNAIHAMSGGGKLRASTAAEGQNALISFTDNGCGIEPEDLERIFDPFFSTKKGSGSGLGLFVVHRLLEAHGGQIEVESEPGRGTICTITLPAAEDDK